MSRWQGAFSKSTSKIVGKRRKLEDMKYKDLIPILDKEVSLYVRLSAADSRGIVRCVTCGSYHHWEDITLGHYISRGKHSVRWNLKNVAPQCRHCNSFLGGEQYKMRAYLVNQYGEKTVEAMEAWADMTKTETSETLRMKIAEYREKNKALKKQQRVLS